MATGALITSLSSHRCQRILPVFRSSAASTCEHGGPAFAPAGLAGGFAACAGRLLARPGPICPPPAAGYEVNTIPLATVGVLVSGSPSQCDHRCLPVSASTAKMVQLSVLNTITPSSPTAALGPSSSMSMAQTRPPVAASKQ